MKIKFQLTGQWESRRVWLNGKRLSPRQSWKVWNHSPDGFAWGYGGSGPAQLALAIMLKFYSENKAIIYHQDFKWKCIASLPQADFDKELEWEPEKESEKI